MLGAGQRDSERKSVTLGLRGVADVQRALPRREGEQVLDQRRVVRGAARRAEHVHVGDEDRRTRAEAERSGLDHRDRRPLRVAPDLVRVRRERRVVPGREVLVIGGRGAKRPHRDRVVEVGHDVRCWAADAVALGEAEAIDHRVAGVVGCRDQRAAAEDEVVERVLLLRGVRVRGHVAREEDVDAVECPLVGNADARRDLERARDRSTRPEVRGVLQQGAGRLEVRLRHPPIAASPRRLVALDHHARAERDGRRGDRALPCLVRRERDRAVGATLAERGGVASGGRRDRVRPGREGVGGARRASWLRAARRIETVALDVDGEVLGEPDAAAYLRGHLQRCGRDVVRRDRADLLLALGGRDMTLRRAVAGERDRVARDGIRGHLVLDISGERVHRAAWRAGLRAPRDVAALVEDVDVEVLGPQEAAVVVHHVRDHVERRCPGEAADHDDPVPAAVGREQEVARDGIDERALGAAEPGHEVASRVHDGIAVGSHLERGDPPRRVLRDEHARRAEPG